MKEALIDYVREYIDNEFDAEQDDLIDYLDSVSLLQMIQGIRDRCGVSLNLGEIDVEAFTTIDTLVNMLEAKKTGSLV